MTTGDLSVDWKNPRITNDELIAAYGRLAPADLMAETTTTRVGSFATAEEAKGSIEKVMGKTRWYEVYPDGRIKE